MKMHEQFEPVQLAANPLVRPTMPPDLSTHGSRDALLRSVRSNIVQSIRAFHVSDLQDAAQKLGQHFLYANLASTHSKQGVLEAIGREFMFPAHYGRNFDALYDCMTEPLSKSGEQPGFIVVLEKIPDTSKFDREAREQLLDVFRDAADYWADRGVPFRCFYSFQ